MNNTHKRRRIRRWLCTCNQPYSRDHYLRNVLTPNDYARLRGGY